MIAEKEAVADQGTVFIQIQLQQRRYLVDTRASWEMHARMKACNRQGGHG
jgi:hypothetical protein